MRWTDQHKRKAVSLHLAGFSYLEIGMALDRPRRSIAGFIETNPEAKLIEQVQRLFGGRG